MLTNGSWQAGSDKPFCPGIYVRNFGSAPTPAVLGDLYCKWDGEKWGAGRNTSIEAMDCNIASQFECLPWRETADATN